MKGVTTLLTLAAFLLASGVLARSGDGTST
jgi:hypothetical protein